MEAAIIPLSYWQDPQGDMVLVYSERECSIFFGCWATPGQPADYIGHLSFERAAAVRSFRREFVPYRPPTHTEQSYILRVDDSEFLREHVANRQQHYPQFPGPSLQHFVAVGHDRYHEVLAASFAEATIPAADVSDERLLALYRRA